MYFQPTSRIRAIDGIRGVSIFLVLIDHYIYFSGNNFLSPILSYFINSKNGVDLFFIISGFLITNILLIEHIEKGQIDLLKFYLRRAIRILPAFYFLLLLYFILFKLNIIWISNSTWIGSFLFFRQFLGSGWETSHFWSLSVENVFYFLIPILFNRIKIIRLRSVLFFSSVLILILPFLRYFISSQTTLSSLNIFFRCEGLIFGSLIAFINIFYTSKLDNKKIICTLIISTLFIILFESTIFNNFNSIFKFIIKEYKSILIVFNLTIFFYFIINLKKGFFLSVINNSILIFFGVISYSIYLWQQLFFSKNDFFNFQNLIYRLIAIFLISLFSYFFVERPFNRLKIKIK